MRALPLALLAILAACATPARAQDRAQLDSVTVHLFLEGSGTLSSDVTAREGFSSRNFVPDGPGMPEGERFDSIVIRLRFTARGELFAKGPQAEVTLTDRWTKKLVKRLRVGDVYISARGSAYVPVFAEHVACTPLEITVAGGSKRIVKALDFSCGE